MVIITVSHREDEVRNYYVRLFKDFIKIVPAFGQTISGFEENPDTLVTFISRVSDYMRRLSFIQLPLHFIKLVTASNEARSEDSGSLKHNGIVYIPKNPETDVVRPPIPRTQSKAFRGFNHPDTGRLLCPRRYIKEFDRDPYVIAFAMCYN